MATKKTKRKSVTPRRPAGPDLETVAYPRAGDNPELREMLRLEIEGAPESAPGSADEKARMGRPPGTGKHQRAAREMAEAQVRGLDETVVADMWRLPFSVWAVWRKIQALELSDAEAVALAKPSVVLLNHYAGGIDPIQVAWYQLSGVLATLTISRLLIVRQAVAPGRPAQTQQSDLPKTGPADQRPADVEHRPGKVTFQPADEPSGKRADGPARKRSVKAPRKAPKRSTRKGRKRR